MRPRRNNTVKSIDNHFIYLKSIKDSVISKESIELLVLKSSFMYFAQITKYISNIIKNVTKDISNNNLIHRNCEIQIKKKKMVWF